MSGERLTDRIQRALAKKLKASKRLPERASLLRRLGREAEAAVIEEQIVRKRQSIAAAINGTLLVPSTTHIPIEAGPERIRPEVD